MLNALQELNEELKCQNVRAEMNLYGGAVMCLVLGSRLSTDDIDAVFTPKMDVYKAASRVAKRLGLSPEWLNDGVKGFLSSSESRKLYRRYTNITLYTATPEYMFAMKAVSCRIQHPTELDDIRYLINYLKIRNYKQAISVIAKYYPPKRVQVKTQYMLQEIFGEYK
jgi:hypothetical protein